jgi:thymidylate synthase (FAD)
MNKISVLDKGYVRIIPEGCSGSDLTIVNSARVSYDKESMELDGRDERLINFLAREGHTSPFRHATLQFEVYAPLMVARQWWKYIVGSDHTLDAWNESSRRYITEDTVNYVPMEDEWRSAPENSKQGSGDVLDSMTGLNLSEKLMAHIRDSEALYEDAMSRGVCAEQARLFLPAYGMYVRWYWTASLQSVAHLINQRTKPDAQFEFQLYAETVKKLTKQRFPVATTALTEG